MRSTAATLEWYRTHRTRAQLGFDPDGMCLKVCRVARGIGAKYPSAVSAQQATPAAHRIRDVSKIRVGMVVYYDDPRDSNPYGHVVTVVGRDPSKPASSLGSLIVATNTVKADSIVNVPGDYFLRHWGDEFQFAATWLNGVALDLSRPAPQPARMPRLEAAIAELRASLEWHQKRGNTRLVNALKRDIAELQQTIRDFS